MEPQGAAQIEMKMDIRAVQTSWARRMLRNLKGAPCSLELQARPGRLPVHTETPLFQLRVYDLVNNRFRKYSTFDGFATHLDLEPGLYAISVRQMLSKGESASNWSGVLNCAVHESGEVRTGSEALATHPVKGAFYRNAAILQESIDKAEAVLEGKPFALSLILEGRGCNFKCFYCSHILPGHAAVLRPDRVFTKSETIDPNSPLKVPYVAGRTIGTSDHLIRSVIDNFPYTRTIMFGGSEPTIYPEFWQVVDLLKDYPDVQASVCTNASRIDDELAGKLVQGNFPWIRVSIDGATEETFRKIRKGDFNQVIGNLRRIVRARGKNKMPRLQFNFVCTRTNHHEIVKLVHLAKDVGVEAINYKMLITPRDNSPFTQPFRPEDPLSSESLCARILDLMDEAKIVAAQTGVRIVADAISSAIYSRYPGLKNRERRDEFNDGEGREEVSPADGVAASSSSGSGPVGLSEHVTIASNLYVRASCPASETLYRRFQPEKPGLVTVEFGRDGGAYAQIMIESAADDAVAVRYQAVQWSRFAVDLAPGEYRVRLRPYRLDKSEQRQQAWGEPLAITVNADGSTTPQGGEPVTGRVDAILAAPVTSDGEEFVSNQDVARWHFESRKTQSENIKVEDHGLIDAENDLEETENNESVIEWKDVFCHLPFTNLSVGHNRAHFCCWATQKYNSIGFYGDDIGVEDLWNHPTLVEAREFMLAGQAEKVCRPNCPHLAGGGVKSAFLRDPVKEREVKHEG